jgi:IS1 family transposase
VLTDGQRIDRMRRRLEDRLRHCTDKAERTRLIDAYNSQVRRMNIRYRRTALYREDSRDAVKS